LIPIPRKTLEQKTRDTEADVLKAKRAMESSNQQILGAQNERSSYMLSLFNRLKTLEQERYKTCVWVLDCFLDCRINFQKCLMESLETLKRDVSTVNSIEDLNKWIEDHASSELPPNSIIERHRMGFTISLEYEINPTSTGSIKMIDENSLIGETVLDTVFPSWKEDVAAGFVPLTKSEPIITNNIVRKGKTSGLASRLSLVLPRRTSMAKSEAPVEFKYDIQDDDDVDLSFSESTVL
jgi:hypothetical protein